MKLTAREKEGLEAKRLYQLICSGELTDEPDSLQKRVVIIQEIEKITGQCFKNTEDFHLKMQIYFGGNKYTAKHLKLARKKKDWKQFQLAAHLGTNRTFVAQMESGVKSLTTDALQFIEEMEISTHVPEASKHKKVTFISKKTKSLKQDFFPSVR